MMDSRAKAARLADQIRDYLAIWSHQDYPQLIFSITQVTLTPDKGRATAWVEISDPSQRTHILSALKQQASKYKHKLHQSLNKQSTPDVVFLLDENLDLNERFDDLLKS